MNLASAVVGWLNTLAWLAAWSASGGRAWWGALLIGGFAVVALVTSAGLSRGGHRSGHGVPAIASLICLVVSALFLLAFAVGPV